LIRRAKRCCVDPRLRIAFMTVRCCSVRNPLSINPLESINRVPSSSISVYERVGVYPTSISFPYPPKQPWIDTGRSGCFLASLCASIQVEPRAGDDLKRAVLALSCDFDSSGKKVRTLRTKIGQIGHREHGAIVISRGAEGHVSYRPDGSVITAAVGVHYIARHHHLEQGAPSTSLDQLSAQR